MRVPSVSPRQQKAARQARKDDERFFRQHPDRRYRRRPSLPLEHKGWRRESHLAEPITLVIRPTAMTRDYVTLPLTGDIRQCPDKDEFLSPLWVALQARAHDGPGAISFTPEEHARLLEATGCTIDQEHSK